MMPSRFILIIIITCSFQMIVGCINYPDSGKEIRMELPAYDDKDCIIEYMGFSLSYNEELRIPNWVAYELTSEEVVMTPPPVKGTFTLDPNSSMAQSDANDYKGSGWSRGHMAPAADFKWGKEPYLQTFFYTNCCPQNQDLNNGSWNVLENRVRKWASQFGTVYVVTGPIVDQNSYGKIGLHSVCVPDAFFKAILVYSDEEYHGIAFMMVNNSIPQRLPDSYMSIYELESVTGFDFFPALDDSIEEIVEEDVNLTFWQIR